ncbi:unnamed protein product [Tilletia controversa]|nr:unnamed protein product [Tilletia controversa]
MSSTTTTDFSAYPSDQLTPSEMDHLEVLVDKLILGTKKRDEDGRRVDDHRWDPTSFGGGVDIMTIRGVPKLLDQHKAQFGINNNAICVLAKAMAKYAGHCGARDRLESRIESLIKAGLTESSSSSSDASDADDDAAPNDAASDDDASDEGEGEGHEHDGDASDDASDQDASGEDASDDDAEDDDNASNSGSGSDSCTSTSVHSKANLITDANSDTDSDSDTDGSSAMSFTQCYNTVNTPLPTYTALDAAAIEADESCSTSSGSSSAYSDLMSMSFTPVHVTSRPMPEERSDVGDTDGERTDSPCSTSSYSSSASSDSIPMSFTPVYVASRPIAGEPSTINGINDVDDDNDSDSCYDESTSSSIVSEQYSPCLYATGVQATAPRRFRYRGLLPTIIGRPARDFSMRQLDAQTPSRIPVRTLQVKTTHQTAMSPAGRSQGRESFPSFVIGGIEPRPAGSIKARHFKAIKPIVAAPHIPWFMRSPPRVNDIKLRIAPRVSTPKSSGQRSRIPVRTTPAH